MVRAVVLLVALAAHAADWPQWRGEGRAGVWAESGITTTLGPGPLTPTWRTPIRGGYSAPVVSSGRVFVTDYAEGTERAVALEERSGRILWTREWAANYRGVDYGSGPRAAPTVDGPLVFVLGAVGHLAALRAADGAVVWEKELRRDYDAEVPVWGLSAAPLVVGERLIVVANGKPNAKVAAFDKRTGRELWRALSPADSEPGYSQPILARAGGREQAIVWHAGAVTSLDPATGETLWNHPFRIHMNTPIATPVLAGDRLLVSGFFNGARLLRFGPASAELLWAGQSTSETNTDTLNALMNAPVIDGEYIYGICNYGQLRCLRLATGERVWESQQVTVEKARNVSAFIVRHGAGYVFFNDRGELIFGRLAPTGYTETARAALIRPTSKPGARREKQAVVWAHPAFANRAVIARNDEEILRVSLAAR